MYVLITKKDGTRLFALTAISVETRITNSGGLEAVIKANGISYTFDLSRYDIHVDYIKDEVEDLILEQMEQM